MASELIPRGSWRGFLDGFSRAHEGWLVTIEAVPTNAPSPVMIRDVPLVGVWEDAGRVVIATGRDSAHADRIIDRAVKVVLDRAGDGSERGLEIQTEDGEAVRLRFRSAMPTHMVDGV